MDQSPTKECSRVGPDLRILTVAPSWIIIMNECIPNTTNSKRINKYVYLQILEEGLLVEENQILGDISAIIAGPG